MKIFILLCFGSVAAFAAPQELDPFLESDGWAFYTNGAIAPIETPEIKRAKKLLSLRFTFKGQDSLATSRNQLPEAVEQLPEAVEQLPEAVKQLPEAVEQLMEAVEQLPEAVVQLSEVEQVPADKGLLTESLLAQLVADNPNEELLPIPVQGRILDLMVDEI